MEANSKWRAQEPPPDFADRVMARIAGEVTPPARVTRRGGKALAAVAAGVLALAASAAVVFAWRASRETARGEAVATKLTEIEIGSRAAAVLERGARLSWMGDVVSQDAGEVFYRVERGGRFRVHTREGDVEVLGTCFRVSVREGEEIGERAMNGRDVKAGVVGAAVGAGVLVSVYEGRVALSHESARVTLSAGESGRADAAGVHRGVDGAGASSEEEATDPLLAANANLADSVREYKRRLESLETKKKTLESELAAAQQKLDAAPGGGDDERSEFDLSQDDWKELAKEGEVRARVPCRNPPKDELSQLGLEKAGLSPGDLPAVRAALDGSRKRMWAAIRPLCVQALAGDAALADRLGSLTCQSIVQEAARENGEDFEEEIRQVAEIRAGLRPVPADGGGSVTKLWLALTGEAGNVEQDLARSVGPDDARRFVYGSAGCWNDGRWGVGPRRAP
jgi:ferric-dicitrate binding protein FerR (iron transport regulator)